MSTSENQKTWDDVVNTAVGQEAIMEYIRFNDGWTGCEESMQMDDEEDDGSVEPDHDIDQSDDKNVSVDFGYMHTYINVRIFISCRTEQTIKRTVLYAIGLGVYISCCTYVLQIMLIFDEKNDKLFIYDKNKNDVYPFGKYVA